MYIDVCTGMVAYLLSVVTSGWRGKAVSVGSVQRLTSTCAPASTTQSILSKTCQVQKAGGGGGDGCFGMCTAPWTRTCTFCCVLTTVKHREGESQGATATWRGCTHKPSTQPTPEIHAQLINAIASFKYGVTRWFIGHHNIGLACFSLTPHTLLHPTPAHTFHT